MYDDDGQAEDDGDLLEWGDDQADDQGDDDERCPDCGSIVTVDDSETGTCPSCLTEWRIGTADDDMGEDPDDEQADEGGR